MVCCGEPRMINFDKYINDFPALKGIGRQNWPVFYDPRKSDPIIMIHSPVGTDVFFNDNNKFKVVISGFCTSLEACSKFLKDKFIDRNSEPNYLEYVHTFNSSALRTNITKICKKIGLLEKFGTSGARINLLELIKGNPTKYPILMTQALCCVATKKESDAKLIIKKILRENLEPKFKKCLENSLNAWLSKITQNKSNKCILFLLGFAKKEKSAIQLLLKNSSIDRNGTVYIGEIHKISLLEHLKKIFNDFLVFIPHPAQLTNTKLEEYLKTKEGKKAISMVNGIF